MSEEEWSEEIETPRKRASHIRGCSAFGCTSKGYRLLVAGERVQYFQFPLTDRVLCQRWAAAIKLPPGTSYEKAYVCSKHFRSGDYRSKSHDDGKKSLRRIAIPSLAPVVPTGKGRQRPQIKTASSSESEEEVEDNVREITTLVSKESVSGENLTLLLVKNGLLEHEDDDEIPEPKILQNKKLPLRCEDLLLNGPPYPWRNESLSKWLTDRLTAHQDQMRKTREQVEINEQACEKLEEDVAIRCELIANYILKKHMGRLTPSQCLRQKVV